MSEEKVIEQTAEEMALDHATIAANQFREQMATGQERNLFENFVFLYLNSLEGLPTPERVDEACRVAMKNVGVFMGRQSELVKALHAQEEAQAKND